MLGVMIGAHPVGGTGPKAGFLYIRVLEAGNLEGLISTPSCCRSSSSGCSSSFFSCSGCTCTSSAAPEGLQVGFSCICLERTVRTKVKATVDALTGTATFREEMLLRALNFCSADQLKVTLENSGTVLAEAVLPMRASIPDVLLACASSDSQDVEEPALLSPNKAWLPRHRAVLRPTGLQDFSAQGAGGWGSKQPYIELELLQLVDGSLPAALGSKPLMLALENKQEQLVRGYLSFDYVERLSLQEQALCITAAIQQRSPFMLLQLLDQIHPTHEHLIMAIRLGQEHLLDPLLHAGGLALVRSKRLLRRAQGGQGRGPSADDRPSPRSGAPSSSTGADPSRSDGEVTPLALACSLGHVGCVEALCLWGRRQRLQIDPTAPQVTPLNLARRELLGVIGWEDIDTSTLGDPPMIMVVRGQGSLEQKLQLISVLCSYNFSVDVRSPRDSWTPLLAAVERGSIELVQALVAQGARSSPDSVLGFTPLHLACQMGHWHLISCLVEAMNKQYRSMSAWGPSPQYVSLNVADVYGRTALDIALLRYFNDESESYGAAAAAEGNGQKAVNVLREFIHRRPADDAGVVCGWELLQVMNLIAIPSKKAMNAQLADCNRMVEGSPNSANADSGEADKETAEGFKDVNDVREVLEAVRMLVKAGAQTRFLLEDLLEPATNPPVASPIFKSAAQPARTSPKYSLQEGEVGEMEDSVDDESFTS
ncbi:ANK2 [Symbiodinium sp. CCMP2456]|nr:ANK2 [Symbiodinium sp. CCMP2456]